MKKKYKFRDLKVGEGEFIPADNKIISKRVHDAVSEYQRYRPEIFKVERDAIMCDEAGKLINGILIRRFL